MELKLVIIYFLSIIKKSFNRTFMELKHGKALLIIFIIACFNRTFMELKQYLKSTSKVSFTALIGPLWNWNSIHAQKVFSFRCFNRTFMELKPEKLKAIASAHSALIGPLWNWNTVHKSVGKVTFTALIGPLWNWNYFTWLIKSRGLARFNRTFMELKPRRKT